MKVVVLRKTYTPLVKIASFTSLAIIISQVLSRLVVYHLFSFELYLSVVAIAFLLTGYFLKLSIKQDLSTTIDGSVLQDDRLVELNAIFYNLTNREVSIFRLVAEGKTNKEIAAVLNISISTVKTHTNNLYLKISRKNRKEARELWCEMMKKGVIL